MENRNKKEWREEFAKLSKALSHPHRIKIIEILATLPSDESCIVGSIVNQLSISQSTVSQHLKVLKEAGWIKGIIDGPRVCYCLKEDIFQQYKKMINNLVTCEYTTKIEIKNLEDCDFKGID